MGQKWEFAQTKKNKYQFFKTRRCAFMTYGQFPPKSSSNLIFVIRDSRVHNEDEVYGGAKKFCLVVSYSQSIFISYICIRMQKKRIFYPKMIQKQQAKKSSRGAFWRKSLIYYHKKWHMPSVASQKHLSFFVKVKKHHKNLVRTLGLPRLLSKIDFKNE